MMRELRFAAYAVKKNIMSSAELRTSFLMNIVGMAINNSSLVIIWIFFVHSVGTIGGWDAIDIVGLQGYIALAYGIVFSFGFGLRKLPEYVASGAFDRFLLSPKNVLARLLTSAFSPSAIGDLLYGAICIVLFLFLSHAGILQFVFSAFLAVISIAVFFAAALFTFSLSFFFTDAEGVTNGFFELFLTPSLFHGGAFQGVMRFVFMFIIPSLVAGTLPVEAIRQLSWETLFTAAIIAAVWAVVSYRFFFFAARRYESASFFTFGN